MVVQYLYNAWGKVLKVVDADGNTVTSGVGYENPLRYRGYYYDWESGFYYLNSRYYDPEIGRFISPDSYISTGVGILSNNMYAYCWNNPVNYYDSYGKFGESVLSWWTATMWVPAVAEPTFFGEILYAGGCAVLGGIAVIGTICAGESIAEAIQDNNNDNSSDVDSNNADGNIPDIEYPGDDPTVPPGDDYEWHGKEPVGGDKGAWVNDSTGEQLHPDLNHPMPKGPHWDYTRIIKGIKEVWSLFKDGRITKWK